MKSLIRVFALGALFATPLLSGAQCTITGSPAATTIICGEEVNLLAAGTTTAPVLSEDFNSGSLGPGWNVTQPLIFGQPCSPTLDGTNAGWMGSAAGQPRELSTVDFNLPCGAEICFELDFAADDNTSGNCEDPDLTTEGVSFEYSTDGGANWNLIFYHPAVSGYNNQYYQWGTYCYQLPAAGFSATTSFRWSQIAVSSNVNDHWGLDNITIQPIDCGNNYYYEIDDNVGGQGLYDGDTIVSPVASTTYDVIYTNGVDDTCNTQMVVTVNPINLDIICDSIALDCGECTSLDVILSPAPTNNPNPNYTYSWSPAGTLSSTTGPNTVACPFNDETYQVDLLETNSGCTASETINITMNSGSAVANFTPSVLSGCAPLTVNFTNTSIGQTYVWDMGDGGSTTDYTTQDATHVFAVPGTYTVSLTAQIAGAACADSTISVDIVVGNNITPIADFDFVTSCGESTVVFTNTGTPNLTYTWDMGDGGASPDYTTFDATHTFAANGTYTVTLTTFDAACGTQDVTTETIAIVDNPITFTYEGPLCHDDSNGSITVGFQSATGTQNVTMTNTATNVQVNPGGGLTANLLPSGAYLISVDLGGACQVDTLIVFDNPADLEIDLVLTDVLCNGDATGVAYIDTVYNYEGIHGTNQYGDISYQWQPLLTGVAGNGTDSLYNLPAGTYFVTVASASCSRQFEFEITEADPVVIDTLAKIPSYCRLFPFQNGGGTVFVSASGGSGAFTYLWTNTETGAQVNNSTWGGLNPGVYNIFIQDGNDCVFTEDITLDSISPIADFTLSSSQFTAEWEGTAPVSVVFDNTSQNYVHPSDLSDTATWVWNLDTANNANGFLTGDYFLSPDTTYLNGGTYTVCLEITSGYGCTDMHCEDIIIYDDLLFQPVNIFTPNGDGDNDVFTFDFVSFAVKEFSCVIVNRWGQKVAEFNDISQSWDGTKFGGGMCSDGTFFYTYQGEAENGELFDGQGTITKVSGE